MLMYLYSVRLATSNHVNPDYYKHYMLIYLYILVNNEKIINCNDEIAFNNKIDIKLLDYKWQKNIHWVNTLR